MLRRRKYPRLTPRHPGRCGLQWRNGQHVGSVQVHLNDLSLGGCSVASPSPVPPGHSLVTNLHFAHPALADGGQLSLVGRVVRCMPHDGGFMLAIEFAAGQDATRNKLARLLASPVFVSPGKAAALPREQWGVEQWSTFFEQQAIPVLPYSKMLLTALKEQAVADGLSAADLAGIAANDPLLVLTLMRQVESRRTPTLLHNITTLLGCILVLGIDRVRQIIEAAPVVEEADSGLIQACEISILAARLARNWAMLRHDVNPDEVVLAALLARGGELLLRNFSPELPLRVDQACASGRFANEEEAQLEISGFRYRDLTLRCATHWHFPPVLLQLARGNDNHRVAIPRIANQVARHLRHDAEAAVISELQTLEKHLPGTPLAALLQSTNDVAGTKLIGPLEHFGVQLSA